jgi:hypothetical protein
VDDMGHCEAVCEAGSRQAAARSAQLHAKWMLLAQPSQCACQPCDEYALLHLRWLLLVKAAVYAALGCLL